MAKSTKRMMITYLRKKNDDYIFTSRTRNLDNGCPRLSLLISKKENIMQTFAIKGDN